MANRQSNRGVRPKTCKPVGPFHVLACPRIMLATKGVTDLPRERVRDLAASVLSSPRNHKDKAVAMAGEGSPPHDRSSIESGNQRPVTSCRRDAECRHCARPTLLLSLKQTSGFRRIPKRPKHQRPNLFHTHL